MSLAPGSRLGAYEVLSPLGAGGMGEVYRARDTMLRRDVAIKVVHPNLVGEPEHLARFRQEARALATLNHPHVATIHGFDESDGTWFVVMELVPGETLDQHVTGQRLPLTDTLRIFVQIASALEAAHDKGIIHRDLKPANIKITPEGAAKVLDFGLAKALSAEDAAEPLSRAATVGTTPGLVMGTPAYMSPEQTRGRNVDRRTDIWAFGCVLYEALTHQNPFAGDTVSDTIVRVLEREPDWKLLPDATPATIRRLIARCLEKDANRRLRDIGDARLEIEDVLANPAQATHASAALVAPRRRYRPWAYAIGMLAVGIVLGAAIASGLRPNAVPPSRPAAHVVIPLPSGEQLAAVDFPAIAIAPDGSYVVYVGGRGGRTQLFGRPMNGLAATPLDGTADAFSPFFSPDSKWVAFFAQGKLKKLPLAGGPPVTLCDADIGFGGSWAANDVIVFAPTTGSPLSQVSAHGGTPTRVTALDTNRGEFSHRWPHLLPDGKTVLFTVGTLGNWDDAEIVAQSLSGGERRVLIKGGTNPHYLPSGHLLFARAGSVMAVPFDAGELTVSGSPVSVLPSVQQSFDGAAQISVSSSSAVLFVPGAAQTAPRRLMTVDRSGSVIPLAAPPRGYALPRVSPNGRQLALTITNGREDVWLYDVASGTPTQLTFEGDNTAPIWTPDGQRLTFSSNRAGALNLYTTRADGGAAPERLASSDHIQLPGSWSPDGAVLAFVELRPSTGRDILFWRAETRSIEPFLATSFDESSPRFSRDGRWIAYVSNESGRNEVYVRPLADPAQRSQVSVNGGSEPVWGLDGRELFFRTNEGVMSASVEVRPTAFRASQPRLLFSGSFEMGTLDRVNYDVAATSGFTMVQSGEQEAQGHELHLLLNWVETLPALIARTGR